MHFNRKQAALLVVFLIVTNIITGQVSKTYSFRLNHISPDSTYLAGNDKIQFSYSVSELIIEEVINDFGTFYRLMVPGHVNTTDPGKPELPVLSRMVTVPENTLFEIHIKNVVVEKVRPSEAGINGILYPAQVQASKNGTEQQQGFLIDKLIYESDKLINSDTVTVELLGKVRGKQLATFAVHPVRYNPAKNELEIITSMDIEILFNSGELLQVESNLKSVLIDDLVSKSVVNYNPGEVINGFSEYPVGMIILTDTTFKKHIQPLVKWKKQKGYKVDVLYRGAHYAGTTYDEIKAKIKSIYDNAGTEYGAPEYLLIIGDLDKIPRSGGTSNISDLYWGEFDGGGDYIPEMMIGRLPAKDTNEVKAVVNKAIQYEKFMFETTNKFYSKTLVTAGNDATYKPYMNGQVRYAITTYLNQANNISGYHFFYPKSGSAEDTIKKLINTGLGFINYSGHGDAAGWVSPSVNVSDIDLFTNKNMYPFIISNACRTAQFSSATNFGARLITSDEKGAIGFIGCTNDSYWDEDYYWSVGFGNPRTDTTYNTTGLGAYDRLFHTHGELPSDWYISMGQVNFAGNLSVSSSTSNRKKYYWETYNLLGDPSIIPIIGNPGTFSTVIPDTLPSGIRSVSFICEPQSYIAISDFETLWDASYVSPSGTVFLSLPAGDHDSCLIVITGQNKKPVIKTVYFQDVEHEFLNLESFSVNDTNGNNNAHADYAEAFYLEVRVSNLGLSESKNLYAEITTDSPWITIINDSVFVGSLSGKSQITLSDDFIILVKDSIPDKGRATVKLRLKSENQEKQYIIDISLYAPYLTIPGYVIDDSGLGNNNHLADPGETIKIVFKVQNTGTSKASGQFRILNQPNGTVIPVKQFSTGDILPGSIVQIPVDIVLSQTILPGTLLEFKTQVDCSPYRASKIFSLSTGMTRESFEYQNFTIFPWINTATYPWIITNSQSFEGLYSARSGVISHTKESQLGIIVNQPVSDTIVMRVKTSSEFNYDYLICKLNNVQKFTLSGETDWLEKVIILPAGLNRLEFIYKKDESVSSGSDCAWIDFITFPQSAFGKRDLAVSEITNPLPNNEYYFEYINAKVINMGREVMNGFNLAYVVNDNSPVSEFFNININPGDTASIQFTNKANLSVNGTYLISVYGFDNTDAYPVNDSTMIAIINTGTEEVADDNYNEFLVLSNPVSNNINLKVNSSAGDEIEIRIYDLTGNLLSLGKHSVYQGANYIVIDGSAILPGTYLISYKGKLQSGVRRIIKV